MSEQRQPVKAATKFKVGDRCRIWMGARETEAEIIEFRLRFRGDNVWRVRIGNALNGVTEFEVVESGMEPIHAV